MSQYTYTGLFRLFPMKSKSADGFAVHDKELIKASVVNIIKTHKGSRVYDMEYGTNLHRLIHELNIQRIRNIAKNEIEVAVAKYEPRVKVSKIETYAEGENSQKIVVIMTLTYLEFDESEILEIKLDSDTQWINKEGKPVT